MGSQQGAFTFNTAITGEDRGVSTATTNRGVTATTDSCLPITEAVEVQIPEACSSSTTSMH